MNESIPLKSCKRSIELYLRALWGNGFSLQCAESGKGLASGYLVGNVIRLPEQVPWTYTHQYYRAAATHAALHNIYGHVPFEKKDLNLMQRTMIGLVEDLRVELLAINQFPGLRNLWIGLHEIQSAVPDSAQHLMLRLSLAVLDDQYEDKHQWIIKGRQIILNEMNKPDNPDLSLRVGLRLANDMGQMRLPLNSGKHEQPVCYRDDNSCLWQDSISIPQQGVMASASIDSSVNQSKLRESYDGLQIELSEDYAQAGPGFNIRRVEGSDFDYQQYHNRAPIEKIFYPEWDYRTQILKQKWCTVIESRSPLCSAEKVTDIFATHKVVLSRLRQVAIKLRAEKMQRVRKTESGDELDFDPMISAMVALRSDEVPDMRIFMQSHYRKIKSLAISILLDLSESTNEVIASANASISSLIRDAVLLLGETLTIADEKFSVSGFSSNGRHEVNINSFKKFNESFDDSKTRLSDIRGLHSTRLGTAIRHSGYHLAQQPETRKLLLVITDGVPSDIDVFDRYYLEHESRHAVQALKGSGIKSFCINLNSLADPVIEHIFGKGRYETLDRLDRLPEVLSYIYLRHVRH